MKWLEGWLGTAAGVMGALILILGSLFSPISSDAQPTCSSDAPCGPGMPPQAPPQPDYATLILLAVVALLFIGALVGTWLDLRGVRRAGRIVLLICATLLMASLSFLGSVIGVSFGSVVSLPYTSVFFAFAAGVVACLRRDEPRIAATSSAGG